MACSCINDCLIEALRSFLNCSSHCTCTCEPDGCITLNQGTHEVTIKTNSVPQEVFASIVAVGTPVCGGGINMVGTQLLPDGFILYANIVSNSAEVCYIVQSN